MRVLMLSWEFPPYVVGGMGKHVAELAPALGGLDTPFGPIHIDLVTTRTNGGPTSEQLNEYVTVYRGETPPLNPADLVNSVISGNQVLVDVAMPIGDSRPYDLIHVHDWLVTKAGVRLKHRWKTPLVTTIHATERGRHRGHIPDEASHQIDRMEWQSCFEAWQVIACSQFMKQEIQNYFATPADKISVIVNGLNLDGVEECPPEQKDALRSLYAPNGERLLLFVGRIVHEKGLQVLLRAMPRILAEHPNTRLLVAGKNGAAMWPLAFELGVEQSVIFLDFVTNAQRDCLYGTVDAAIFPSLYEPFGIVALEAMACHCNVIASSIGGIGEVVHHLQNGLTVYPNDPLSIAWAVAQVFADPAAAAKRRQAAYNEIKTIYNWQGIARQTAALYADVVADRRATDW